ncbi:hypothetical protein, partial [Undibacterium baiyunense]
TTWYPNFPTTVNGVHFYQPVFWTSGGGRADDEDQNELGAAYDAAVEAKTGLPNTLIGAGVPVLLIGMVLLLVAFSYPKKGAVGGTSSGAHMVD